MVVVGVLLLLPSTSTGVVAGDAAGDAAGDRRGEGGGIATLSIPFPALLFDDDNEEEEEEEEEEKEGERTIPGAAGLEGVDPGAACWSAAPASPNTTRYLYTRSVLASQTSTAVVRASRGEASGSIAVRTCIVEERWVLCCSSARETTCTQRE